MSETKIVPVTFETWWFEIGSGIIPDACADMETHAMRVARAAWEAAPAPNSADGLIWLADRLDLASKGDATTPPPEVLMAAAAKELRAIKAITPSPDDEQQLLERLKETMAQLAKYGIKVHAKIKYPPPKRLREKDDE